MANPAMETKARRVFREALVLTYINGLEVGIEVDDWLQKHGGWFPDPGELYGDGTPLEQPKDEGEDVTSKDPVCAMKEATVLMSELLINLSWEMANNPEDDDYKRLHELASSWVKESDSGKVHDVDASEGVARDRSRSPLRK
jgi:hypothetical protein